MEKLMLRGVMWGADKIPDHYFEKIPGGYYKPKDANGNPVKTKDLNDGQGNTAMKPDRDSDRSSRRYSDDGHDDSDRRHRTHDRDRDDGYRSDGHGRRRDVRKSYDGAEDDNFDLANGRPRRRRSRAGRQRSPSIDDKYRYGDGHVGQSREEREADLRMSGRPPYNYEPQRRHAGPLDQPPDGLGFATGAAAASVPYEAPPSSAGAPQQPDAATRSTSTLRGGMATGYVPYSNIYGGPTYAPQPGSYATPQSDTGSVQPNYMNQVASPAVSPQYQQQGYHQNPFAQEAPLGTQPGYIADPYYNARQYNEPSGRYKDADHRRHGNESETERQYSRSPPRRARSRRDHDDRYDDDDSRDDRHRARSERRDGDRGKSQGRSNGKSRVEELLGPKVSKNVDTTERGLGYSAVGALAGGLLGNEFGKGAIPSALGAVVGAVGANAFQARERRKEEAQRGRRDGGYDRRRAQDGGDYSD